MTYRMITDNEIRSLPLHEQFFAMADAYLDAAIRQTEHVNEVADSEWSDASVAMFLFAHATEMFLKAAILLRAPSTKVKDLSHSIRDLVTEYMRLYPGPEYEGDFRFYTEDMPPDTPKSVKAEINSPSMVFRYSVNKENAQWQTLNGFVASMLLRDLQEIKQTFARLRSIF
ncbi:hypothetical protein HH213_08515 [Duganella dendranthematis]|uniref:HEPN domain-containing protein n=1 Tax=Duganella dendranthematis TaxID=2728021 RepID=A0ABX6M7N0_9BURK|nr:hypothetical protein [Duganella dendranthematis]QJD90135.1 hypothetical protein HH213_08515 [Duganella dendranthematis]